MSCEPQCVSTEPVAAPISTTSKAAGRQAALSCWQVRDRA